MSRIGGFGFADAILDDRAAILPGKIRKMSTEIEEGRRIGVLSGGNRLIFCPGQQFVRGDGRFSHLSGLLVHQFHPFKEFFRMSQKKAEVEGARLVEHLARRLQVRTLAEIRSPLLHSRRSRAAVWWC